MITPFMVLGIEVAMVRRIGAWNCELSCASRRLGATEVDLEVNAEAGADVPRAIGLTVRRSGVSLKDIYKCIQRGEYKRWVENK